MSNTRKARRIGPKMRAATAEVTANPGARKMTVADAIGPNGSRKFGYAAVDRAIRAGLISAEEDSRGYRLTVTDKGRKAIGE